MLTSKGPNAGICLSCHRRLHTWSENLRESYNGCNLFLDEKITCSVDSITDGIKAEVIALGWVGNGVMAFNNQLIVRNATHCTYFQK